MSTVIDRLSALITSKGLTATIDNARVIISSQYDIHYQIVTMGLVIYLFRAKRNKTFDKIKAINRTLLRLVHFLTIRPAMLGDFKGWHQSIAGKGSPSLEEWASFPSAFLSDSAQVDTLTLLLIRGEIYENGKDILLDTGRTNQINSLTAFAIKNRLFQREQDTIAELSALKLSASEMGF